MFKNLKIGMRLTIGFGLLTALLLSVVALSYVRLQEIDASIERVGRVNLPKVEQAHAAIDQVNCQVPADYKRAF